MIRNSILMLCLIVLNFLIQPWVSLKSNNKSEEIKRHVIQYCCLSTLLLGANSIALTYEQIRRLSFTCNRLIIYRSIEILKIFHGLLLCKIYFFRGCFAHNYSAKRKNDRLILMKEC